MLVATRPPHGHLVAQRSELLRGFAFCTGIENSNPTTSDGKGGTLRRDQLAECGFYANWRRDFDLVQEQGLHWLRYGPSLHTTWLAPGVYDWSFADETMADLKRRGIEPIVDLCHFGVPDWIGDFQNRDFPAYFGEYAKAFARRFPWVRYYTPVNEVGLCAVFSGRYGFWNERLESHQGYVGALRNLSRASVEAMHGILDVRPDAVFLLSEDTHRIHPECPQSIAAADHANSERFLPFDFAFGEPVDASMRAWLLEHGMSHDDLGFFEAKGFRHRRHCIVGIDYYATSERYAKPCGERYGSGSVSGLYDIVREYHARYPDRPLFHSETNSNGTDSDGVAWLKGQWIAILRLIREGVPVVGFTHYSICDQMDWDTAMREKRNKVSPVGLYDLNRTIRPAGEAFRNIVSVWAPSLEQDADVVTCRYGDVPQARPHP